MQARTIAELMHIAARLGIGGATPRDNLAAPPTDLAEKQPRV
jgi:hypothetical protein